MATNPAQTSQASGASHISSRDIQTFDQYSQFLRAAVADEESLQLGESLQAMAAHIETLVGLLRQPGADVQQVAMQLLALMDVTRQHSGLVQELGNDWHAFYEFKSHFKTLAHFRTRLALWTREVAAAPPRIPPHTEFELAAWRVLGGGALLLDMYEQSAQQAQDAVAALSPARRRLTLWWRRFLTVLHLKP